MSSGLDTRMAAEPCEAPAAVRRQATALAALRGAAAGRPRRLRKLARVR
jgi:hypothetical protein